MLRSLLQQYWGYDSFRPFQEDIIQAIMSGQDVLAVLPTGGGKSLCYQLPALARNGYALVISPLIALMQDQVLQLQDRNIPAAALHSGLDNSLQDAIINDWTTGYLKLLYVAPERLLSVGFEAVLKEFPPQFIAVDEAHCISQWGHDFRPAYRRLSNLRKQFPKLPIMAITASATPLVVDDIKEQLGLRTPFEAKQTIVRDNLFYHIRYTENKPTDLVNLFRHRKGSAILYCRTRKSCEESAVFLKTQGLDAHYYHAGLSKSEREHVQELWTKSQHKIICATNAFGMGIDKPDINVVAHYGIPESIEAYYQEAGRAGRGGQTAHAVMLYNHNDINRLEEITEQSYPTEQFIRQFYQAVGDFLQIPMSSGSGTMLPFELTVFCRDIKLPLLPAINAMKILEREGYWQWTQDIQTRSMVRFTTDSASLRHLEQTNTTLSKLALSMLRLYGSIFNFLTPIRLYDVAKMLGLDAAVVEGGLRQLSALGYIDYQAAQSGGFMTWLHDRVPAKKLYLDTQHMAQLQAAGRKRLEEIVNFVSDEKTCRNQLLAAYFGFERPAACGGCDVCKQSHAAITLDYKQQLIARIREERKISLVQLIAKFPGLDKGKIIDYIRVLCDEKLCTINPSGIIFAT